MGIFTDENIASPNDIQRGFILSIRSTQDPYLGGYEL